MEPALASHLSAWENFYLITGPSAAALTGLQFVVIALLADVGVGSSLSVSAFGTPTILHFCTVILLAGIFTAPWATLTAPAIVIAVSGIIGVGYMALAMIRSRRQATYKPVLEDWIFYTILPLVAYVALIISGVELRSHAEGALFIVGAVVLLLLFLGIRNAWDTVVYIVVAERGRDAGKAVEETNAAAASRERSG